MHPQHVARQCRNSFCTCVRVTPSRTMDTMNLRAKEPSGPSPSGGLILEARVSSGAAWTLAMCLCE